jgi:CDP-diacylglycerol--glycerol-3-phosphate 3-phosphatidyltransferase
VAVLSARELEEKLFSGPAALLVRLRIHPNAVTGAGTVVVCGVALSLFPLGVLWPGALILAFCATTDSLDGTMARLAGKESKFGAFLDSTLDRVSDAAIVVGLTVWLAREGHMTGVVAGLAALVGGSLVPYARARAEALGYQASVGVLPRAARVALTLLGALLTGLGLPWWVLAGTLGLVAAGSLVTVVQRTWAVARAARGDTP